MIYINKVEITNILATNATINELVVNNSYESEDDLYRELEDVFTFKNEEVQDVFNRWYDYYWNILFDNKIGKEE